MLVFVAEGVLRGLSVQDNPCPGLVKEKQVKQKIAVVLYMHRTAHNLRKIANRVNTKVVFWAPEKLARLCRITNPFRGGPLCCGKKHRNLFVGCAEGVVYT